MPREPRVVLLTGSEKRHRYAAAVIGERVDLVGVVTEATSDSRPSALLSPDDRGTIGRHLAERDAVECQLLGEPPTLSEGMLLRPPGGDVNEPEVADWIQQRQPDLLVVFGASIIRAPLLDLFSARIVNVHLGLSPYYRGAATNFWPLVDRKPECVGATIHLAVTHVDAGPILGQLRPSADARDRAHHLGTKTIIMAFRVLPRVLQRYCDNRITPVEQRVADGRVFRRAAFSAAAVRRMWTNFETGMMPEYVRDGEARCRAYPIVPVIEEEMNADPV